MAQVRLRYTSTESFRELIGLRQRPSDPPPRPADEKTAPIPFRQALALEHVSFSYPGAHGLAIDDVSIVIPRDVGGLYRPDRRWENHPRRSHPGLAYSQLRENSCWTDMISRQPCRLAAKHRICPTNNVSDRRQRQEKRRLWAAGGRYRRRAGMVRAAYGADRSSGALAPRRIGCDRRRARRTPLGGRASAAGDRSSPLRRPRGPGNRRRDVEFGSCDGGRDR